MNAAIARCRFRHLQVQGVVKDGEGAKPAHTSQTLQAAGMWFEHLGCLSEVAAFAVAGHCCQRAAPEERSPARGHGRGGSLPSDGINCLNPLLLKKVENCMFKLIGFPEEKTGQFWSLLPCWRRGCVVVRSHMFCPRTFASHSAVAGQVEVQK